MTYNEPQLNDDITIDFKKILRIILHRWRLIIACYAVILGLAVLLTFVMPKKYVAKATVLINKSSDTNLAEINPFVIGELAGGSSGGLASSLLGGSSAQIENEIALIKSDQVINNVIKENDLKYNKGPREGQFLLREDFLGKNFNAENEKGTNLITFSYKTSDPELAYNIVKSTLENYQEVHNSVNLEKAIRDKSFIQSFYAAAKKDFDEKITQVKEYNVSTGGTFADDLTMSDAYKILLSQNDKRLRAKLQQVPEVKVQNKKLRLDLEQDIERLNRLKERYDWSILVENMAKSTSNLVILNAPRIPATYEFKEPKLIINILLGCVLSFTLAFCAVLGKETMSKKLTYTDVSSEDYFFETVENAELLDLIAWLKAHPAAQRMAFLSLVPDETTNAFYSRLQERFSSLDITKTDKNNPVEEHLENILNADVTLFIVQPEFTERKLYKTLYQQAENKKESKIFVYVHSYQSIMY